MTDYFNVKFYFSNAKLNFVEQIYYLPQQKLREQTHGFKFQSVLFSL